MSGAVAQLGERCVRNAEVEGSTPFRSTEKALFTNSVDKAFSFDSSFCALAAYLYGIC